MRRVFFLIALLIFVPSVCWGQTIVRIYPAVNPNDFLAVSGDTMTGNITMPDDGWSGLASDAGRMVYKDETQDTVMFWDCHIRAETIHATQLNSAFGVYAGNGLVVASGTVDLTGATVNLPSNAVDASAEIATQIIISDDVDSTDEAFVFSDAYHVTSGEADSAYLTHGGAAASYAPKTMLTDTTWDMKNGFVWAGDQNFGTAVLAIPHGQNPTTDANTEIAYDTDNQAIELYDSVSAVSVMMPIHDDKEAVIAKPDELAIEDLPLFHVDVDKYPFGIKLVSLTFGQSAAVSDTFVLHEYSTDTTWASTIDSVVTTAREDKQTTITDSDIAVDAWIFADIANCDVDWIFIKIIFYVKEGD